MQMKTPLRALPVAAFFGAASYVQGLEVAGDLLIDLKASSFSSGASSWTNEGILGGVFTATGTPKAETINGAPAVMFDGQGEYFSGPPTTGLSIEGLNPSWSVEVWVWQGNIRGEETPLAWGKRGGPDGSNASFNYGTNPDWGAMGHWGSPDIGWGDTGTPAAGAWHLLTYTFDGSTTRVYADGVLKNTESPISLNVHTNQFIRIGTQNTDNGSASGDPWFSGGIGQVRVHNGVLTSQQILNNYNEDVVHYSGSAPVAAGLSKGPVNRYSFNNPAAPAPDGTMVIDSVGGEHGYIRGAGAVATGTSIDLPGGSSATAAYIDLPNGIISRHTSITIEFWATIDATSNQKNWSRLVDFGTGTAGEIIGAGGTATGTDYIFLSAYEGDDPRKRFERKLASDALHALNGENGRTSDGNFIGEERHYVLTYDPVAQEWRHYENGLLFDVIPTNEGPDGIEDVNNWLGRSQWTQDANLDGKFNEFRIYDYALSQAEINLNFLSGPDLLIIIPEPSAVSLAFGSLVFWGRRRRRS